MSRKEKGFKMELICTWVSFVDYPKEREREKEKKRETQSQPSRKDEKKGYVCMKNA